MRVIFVVDQMNALQKDPADPELAIRDGVGLALYDSSSGHLRVFGTSANNQSYLALKQKQSNVARINTFGGMTKVIKSCPAIQFF